MQHNPRVTIFDQMKVSIPIPMTVRIERIGIGIIQQQQHQHHESASTSQHPHRQHQTVGTSTSTSTISQHHHHHHRTDATVIQCSLLSAWRRPTQARAPARAEPSAVRKECKLAATRLTIQRQICQSLCFQNVTRSKFPGAKESTYVSYLNARSPVGRQQQKL